MRVKGSYKPDVFEYELVDDGKTAVIRLYENIEEYSEPEGEDGSPGTTGWEFDRYTIQRPHSERLQAQVEEETAMWLAFARNEETQQLRIEKLQMANDTARQIIHSGVEVDGNHFSLTEVDQINLTTLAAQMQAAMRGEESTIDLALGVPYHADGQLCRCWPPEEFAVIVQAVTAHVFYHKTYCNHLRSYIKAINSPGELDAVYYGMELPGEYAESLAALLGTGEPE